MRTVIALLVLATALAGCGASVRSSATTGCKGLSTARRSVSFNNAFGRDLLSRRATIAYVCAHLGPPDRITRAGALVTWNYGDGGDAAILSFKHDRLIEGAWFDRSAPNLTYEIQESETAEPLGAR